jgi:hypothetical protein
MTLRPVPLPRPVEFASADRKERASRTVEAAARTYRHPSDRIQVGGADAEEWHDSSGSSVCMHTPQCFIGAVRPRKNRID